MKKRCTEGLLIMTGKKVNNEVYISPLTFNKKLGFKIQPEIRLTSEKLTAIKISWKK